MSTHAFIFSSSAIDAIEAALSHERFSRYVAATGIRNRQLALQMYSWNAKLCSSLTTPLQVLEVTIRNGVVAALERAYGGNWISSRSFIKSLPRPQRGYSPASDLQMTLAKVSTTGQVISELKFIFWNDMFTSRHDVRIWDRHIRLAFPNLPSSLSVQECRLLLYKQVFAIRKLRNRIAHHEPIFTRDVLSEFRRMTKVISWRCSTTSDWVNSEESVHRAIGERPFSN